MKHYLFNFVDKKTSFVDTNRCLIGLKATEVYCCATS